jgi:isopentenyl-diphosphate Delta-isomerase
MRLHRSGKQAHCAVAVIAGVGHQYERRNCLTELRRAMAGTHPPAGQCDDDQLILVDEFDREIGHMPKADCHAGSGVLHRAFSLFIFNARDELLVQQRSAHKQLWPNYWSNSCCSHPRQAESMTSAIHRRLMEELGLRCTLKFLFKFRYQAQYDASSAEHELCSVFFGRSTTAVHANRQEIADWRWTSLPDLQAQLSDSSRHYTPWFKLEWERIRREHLDDVLTVEGVQAWAFR